jgi:hypothetical protein
MNAQDAMETTHISNGKRLYLVGGISAFVLVLGYILTFPVYAWVGDAPSIGIEPQLVYFAEHATGWWIILGLMVFTDILCIPIFVSLYNALKNVSREGMLLAVGFQGLFIALDLALTWTAYSALITSGIGYAHASTDVQRAVFISAAGYPSAILTSPLLGIYAIIIPSIGVFITGLAMRRGIFNKITAYFAVAAGIIGIAYLGSYISSALSILRIINALLVTVWYGFAGFKLYKLGLS